ncbi:2Fe-2S iron-sulfur cluster-binding protein, partial [Pseudomonas aeruginosa]|uniref:2Fe-2S iron-sulfur cluster-binding protein n=1 Tax=Pseudomonas aeruginosa TaxID=287 RepID=UPI003CC5E319
VVQQASLYIGVDQCGYWQVFQIMSATELLKSNPEPRDEQIEAAKAGNNCRCATYNPIKTAIHNPSPKSQDAKPGTAPTPPTRAPPP